MRRVECSEMKQVAPALEKDKPPSYSDLWGAFQSRDVCHSGTVLTGRRDMAHVPVELLRRCGRSLAPSALPSSEKGGRTEGGPGAAQPDSQVSARHFYARKRVAQHWFVVQTSCVVSQSDCIALPGVGVQASPYNDWPRGTASAFTSPEPPCDINEISPQLSTIAIYKCI